VGLAEGTLGVRFPNDVRVLRLDLLGLGLLADTGGLGLLGTPRVHTTVTRTRQSSITARRTLTSNTLARRLLLGTEEGDFLAKLGNFGEELVHVLREFWEGSGPT